MNKKIFLPIFLLIVSILACSLIPQKVGDVELRGTVTHSTPSLVDKIDAKQAIQTYAQDVLSLQINNLFAGGAAGDISLPLNLQDNVDIAVDLAGTTYFGFWSGGIASLSFGDSDVSGDFVADVRDGTLGVFALTVGSAPPTDAASALNLVQSTYPGLTGYQWVETPSETGYAFTTGEVESVSIESWSVELTGTTINAGVVPGLLNNQSFVWVVVASGVLAAPFQQ
ncbi:MAG: hypothetical protein ACK2U1_20600 [Anaerolineales bacterium]